MDGGFDKAIIEYFGKDLEIAVQKYIKDNYYGEQPFKTFFTIKIPNSDKYLVHTPTMRLPSVTKEPLIVYQCMRVTLMEFIKYDFNSIIIPAFKTLTGKVSSKTVAKYMKEGYCQIYNLN